MNPVIKRRARRIWYSLRHPHLLTLHSRIIAAVLASIAFMLLAYVLEYKQYTTNHFSNVATLVGLAATIAGVFYTYLQLKIANDRIAGYSDFYRWMRDLFNEISSGNADELLFYGPTILPGNVSYSSRDINWLSNELPALFRRAVLDDRSYDKVTSSIVVVPSVEQYEETYAFFKRFRMTTGSELGSDEELERAVDRRKAEAIAVQQELVREELKFRVGCEILAPQDRRFRDISTAYFVSNGKRVIYAKPLHYVNSSQTDEKVEQRVPHLVGFTSTDTTTVRAFREHFAEICGEREHERMRAMYLNHLKTSAYMEKQLQELVDEGKPIDALSLAEFDQDHFGERVATDRFLTACTPRGEQTVVDIGSGFGGPARYIAQKTDCTVVGIELQKERHKFAVKATEMCGLSKKVNFLEGDASLILPALPRFNYAIAFLSILHIPDKERFLRLLGRRIVEGGMIYIEDYVRGEEEHNRSQKRDLEDVIACPGLLPLRDCRKALEAGFFSLDCVEPTTDEWKANANNRIEEFKRNKRDIERKYPGSFEKAQDFNERVAKLFNEGTIQGVRIVATKKKEPKV